DCGQLPTSTLDLERGWVNFPRPKTGIDRRCPLWPETVQAIRDAWADRAPNEFAFVTKQGSSWFKGNDKPVSKEMRKLLDSLGINGPRNSSALAHTTKTIGGEAKDQVALDYIMGHAPAGMASHYRERISNERLIAVSNHIRQWALT